MIEQIIAFWYLAAVAVASGIGVVLFRNPVHSAIALVNTIFHVAGLFVILGAGFLAAVQIIVYAGAIVVLFLFTLMMLNMRALPTERVYHRQAWLAIPLAILVAVEAVFVGVGTPEINESFRGAFAPATISELGGSTQALAEVLFTEYLLPFEVASVLLLVAAIGAIVLARRYEREEIEFVESHQVGADGAGTNGRDAIPGADQEVDAVPERMT